jgi:ABC-2 type transport system permease protein
MTIFGPILMAGLMLVPIWLATKDIDLQTIEIIDETNTFEGQFESTNTLNFVHVTGRDITAAKAKFYDEDFTSILHISSIEKNAEITMYYKNQPGITTIARIEKTIEDVIRSTEIQDKFKITKQQLSEIQPNVTVNPISIDMYGEEESKNVAISSAIGYAGAIIIYFFIFMYGVQIMRGVIEEKTSRIVEIIISSVKPFQLMMGKIIGIALVGLTQFLLWTVLTWVISTLIIGIFSADAFSSVAQTDELMKEVNMSGLSDNPFQFIIDEIKTIPVFQILISFVFYFLGGYLLYGALLAAVGSAVDSEADTQQFMLPITMPLILAFVLASTVVQDPDGAMAFWLSIIPFTSPIIMMVRIPFGGVEAWELLLSMGLLILGFLGTTWVAAKIYRTGILMYGKKVTYKELWKWLIYKG